MNNYTNLIQILKANSRKEKTGITFINGADSEFFLSYSELYKEAGTMVNMLAVEFGLKQGDEVLIYEEDNQKFLICFWACLIGGFIPIPLAVGGKDEHKLKFLKIWNTLKKPIVYTSFKNFDRLSNFIKDKYVGDELATITLNFIDSEILVSESSFSTTFKVTPSDIAFIQYSSGSTGDPKGVVLSHKNLLCNIKDIAQRIQLKESDTALCWIPLTHDLGMIGFHLSSMLVGCSQFIMPTGLFIRRPLLWMEKAHQHKISRLYSPNFGFHYFMQALGRTKELKSWDLSRIVSISNGAEPISAALCRTFLDKLSAYTIHQNCILACYGLAEASVGVTCNEIGTPLIEYHIERKSLTIEAKAEFKEQYIENETVSFVDVGTPFSQCSVRIVTKNDEILEQGFVGHIQVKGDNVTKGYYLNKEATATVFTKDGWLKTGDLGLFVKNGSLIITGRHKNMIIIHGENFYAHDIENILLKLPALNLGGVVACSITGNSKEKEKLIVFILYKKSKESFLSITRSIEEQLSHVIGIIPDEVIPIKVVPKTTSGKVRHSKLLQNYLDGDFDETISKLNQLVVKETTLEWKSLDSKERRKVLKDWLVTQCSILMNIDKKDLNVIDSLGDQGFKSIHTIQFSKLLRKKLGLEVTPSVLYKYPTINKVLEFTEKQLFTDQDGNHEITIPTIFKEALTHTKEFNASLDVTELLAEYKGVSKINEYTSEYVLKAFQEEGIFTKIGYKIDFKDIIGLLSVKPKFWKELKALLEILLMSKHISQKNNIYSYQKLIERPITAASILEKGSKLKAPIEFVDHCVAQLFKVLKEEILAVDLLFPNGSMDLVGKVYKGSALADYNNGLVATFVSGYVKDWKSKNIKKEKIRILEVGAGTGGTSSVVLKTLAPYNDVVEYIYSDVALAFKIYGEKTFKKDYPFLKGAVIDIEKDITKQAISAESIDIVIGSNVLHATQNIYNTISNLKAVLKNNGALVIFELMKFTPFTTVTFGLLDGWWMFNDTENRIPNCPLLNQELWRNVLSTHHFENITFLTQTDKGTLESNEAVIISKNTTTKTAQIIENISDKIVQKNEPDATVKNIPKDLEYEDEELLSKVEELSDEEIVLMLEFEE